MNKKYIVLAGSALFALALCMLILLPSHREPSVTIGITAPLTGPLAEYGEAYRNGVMMAYEESRADEDGRVTFLFEDHQYDSAKAVSAFNKLVHVDGVRVIADWGTGSSYAMAPLVSESDVVFITNSVDPSVTRESERIVRNFYNPEEIAESLWTHFRRVGIKHIAIVKVNILYFNTVTDALIASARPDESVTVIDTVSDFSVTDFRSSILKVRQHASSTQSLGVFLGAGQISTFYQQLAEQGVTIQTFGSDFFESETEIANAQGRMEGAIYANIGASPAFIERYRTRYHTTNQVSFAASGYDLAKILIGTVDYTNTESIMQSLKEVQKFEGVVGTYSFTETPNDRYLKSPLQIKTVRNGAIEVVE